jgi:glycosyltransferase involved in cell wall biosynthesis
MPRLSVLLPVRNGATTIESAVRSTLRALPRDADLHVLDDASDDGTPAVLGRIGDARLVVHRSDTGLGVARGLGRLLEVSDSELVGRMDADDLCLPTRFRRSLRALRRADFVFTTVIEWTPGGRVSPPAPVGVGTGAFPYQLLLTNPVAHSTMVARRAAIDAVGGYREVPAEDYDLWLRAAGAGSRLRRLGIPGLAYRLHPGQVTSAAGWRLASWRNPLVAEAFGDLSEKLVGRRFPRLNALAVDAPSDEEFAATVTAFATAFRTAVAPRPTGERRRLTRLLDARVAAVRRLRSDRRRVADL